VAVTSGRDDEDALERWFHEALAAAPDVRADLLRDLAESEPALADEVAALLRADEEGRSRVERLRRRVRTWADVEAFGPSDAADGLLGRRIGPYRLADLLGRGGMGAVYRAERVDGPFRQTVALKLLPVGLDSPAARERFRREREMLARLRHPGIAQIHDGGVTDDGTPWFAMELVEGTPIDVFCDERHLDVMQRIRLLLDVCRAVGHAHGRLVLHRDLKPANIFVTEEGHVKLLDFGVARLLEEDGAVSKATQLGVPATPAFASPEQLRGEGSAGVSTDVFGLGAVLYHLLAGVGIRASESGRDEPGGLRVDPPDRAFRRLADRAGVARRRSTDPAGLLRQLGGDLRWILARALDEEPGHRYGSVPELEDDLVRFLERRPVQARPGSSGYYLMRWVRRNRAAAVAAVVLLLASGFATSGWIRAVRAEEQARAEAARAGAVGAFLEGIFQLAADDPEAARSVSAADVLERGVAQAEADLSGIPRAQAEVLATLGQAYEGLGLPGTADSVLARAMDLADARLPGDDPSGAGIRFRRALLALRYGDTERARELADEASAIVGRATNVPWQLRADVEWAAGAVDVAQGRYARGEQRLVRAVDLSLDASNGRHVPPRYLLSLGGLHRINGDLVRAETRYEEALRFALDSLPRSGTDYGFALDGLASVLFEDPTRDRRSEAVELRERALEEVAARLGSDHPRMVPLLNNAGAAAHFVGRMDEAVAHYRRALVLAESTGTERNEVLRILGNLGVAERERGDIRAAEDALREAVSRNRVPASGTLRSLRAKHLTDLGLVLRETNRFREARDVLAQAVVGYEAEFGERSAQVAYAVYQEMLLDVHEGRWEGALSRARRLTFLLEGTGNAAVQRSAFEMMARAHLGEGAIDSALAYVRLSEPEDLANRAEWVWTAARVEEAVGRTARAAELRDEGVELAAETSDPEAAVAYAEARRAAAADSTGPALRHLERAERSGLRTLRPGRDPEWVGLRGEPGFEAVLQRLGTRLMGAPAPR